MSDPSVPVVLVHGWAGSFATTWQSSGFTDLLADIGREVIGVDLLGHGAAPKPHDPGAYADLTTRVFEAMPPEGQVDGVGFSLGALTLLRSAMHQPQRFRRLVLAGIGQNAFDVPDDPEAHERFADAIEFGAAAEDKRAGVFASYARADGNDPVPLAHIMRRTAERRFEPADLAGIDCPVLVIIGEHDFAGPGDPLVEALPNARLQVLKKTDHFATPESFGFIDAALDFLGAD